jgi:hypothetical protein
LADTGQNINNGETFTISRTLVSSGDYYLRVYGDQGTYGLTITGHDPLWVGDFDFDNDVDGSDLATLIADPGLLDIATFAENFGKGGN